MDHGAFKESKYACSIPKTSSSPATICSSNISIECKGDVRCVNEKHRWRLRFNDPELEHGFMKQELRRVEIFLLGIMAILSPIGIMSVSSFVMNVVRGIVDFSNVFSYMYLPVVCFPVLIIILLGRRIFDRNGNWLSKNGLMMIYGFVLIATNGGCLVHGISGFLTSTVVFGIIVQPPFRFWIYFGASFISLEFVPMMVMFCLYPEISGVEPIEVICISVLILSSVILTTLFLFYRERTARKCFELFNAFGEKTLELEQLREIGKNLIQNLLPGGYAKRLEESVVDKENKNIQGRRGSSHNFRTMPKQLFSESAGLVFCDECSLAAVLTTDIHNFSETFLNVRPKKLVRFLNFHFSILETIIEKFGFNKLTTNGDSFTCFRDHSEGIVSTDSIATIACNLGLDIFNFIHSCNRYEFPKHYCIPKHQIRIGISLGKLFVYLSGKNRFVFDCCGEAFERAVMLEQNGKSNALHVCERIVSIAKGSTEYVFQKNKNWNGNFDSFFLDHESNLPLTKCDEMMEEVERLQRTKTNGSRISFTTQHTYKSIGTLLTKVESDPEEMKRRGKCCSAIKSSVNNYIKVRQFAIPNWVKATRLKWKENSMSFAFLFIFSIFLGFAFFFILLCYQIWNVDVERVFDPNLKNIFCWVSFGIFFVIYLLIGTFILLLGEKLLVDVPLNVVRCGLLMLFFLCGPLFFSSLVSLSPSLSHESVVFVLIVTYIVFILEFVPISFFLSSVFIVVVVGILNIPRIVYFPGVSYFLLNGVQQTKGVNTELFISNL